MCEKKCIQELIPHYHFYTFLSGLFWINVLKQVTYRVVIKKVYFLIYFAIYTLLCSITENQIDTHIRKVGCDKKSVAPFFDPNSLLHFFVWSPLKQRFMISRQAFCEKKGVGLIMFELRA